MIREPSGESLHRIIGKLDGIDRVIIAGGEPTLRADLPDLAFHLSKTVRIAAMASNVVLMTKELASKLKGSLSYVDVTVDGTREVHNKIRGQYDQVLKGIRNLITAGIDVSMVSVLLSDNVMDMIEICELANQLKAKKLKILTPIRKGRGADIISHGLSSDDLKKLYNLLKTEKNARGWNVRITITDWSLVDEGHALLIHPDGEVVASPVPSERSCIKSFGNLLSCDMKEIWKRYDYKRNHVNKYLEETLYVC